jgi:hypothetical protein
MADEREAIRPVEPPLAANARSVIGGIAGFMVGVCKPKLVHNRRLTALQSKACDEGLHRLGVFELASGA